MWPGRCGNSPRPGRFPRGGTDMQKATNDASTANVVETDAFIVRDPQGRKSILIGNLWPA